MDNTILQQGKFTSDGAKKTLQIRSDVDWMIVYNYSNAAGTGDDSVKFVWQRGMIDGDGLRYYKDGGGDNLNMTVLAVPDGFYLTDTSIQTATRLTNLITDITGGIPNNFDCVAHGLRDFDTVRISNADGASQLGGIDFDVLRINDDRFSTAFFPQIANAAAPGANAYVYKVNTDAQYYPQHRFISGISQAANANIRVSVNHGYKVGQRVRFTVPNVTVASYGMNELDGQAATIMSVNEALSTFTIDIDTRTYTPFLFPLTADAPFIPAMVVPIGQDSAQSLASGVDMLNGALYNSSYIGMVLPGGADAPGGADNDVMYWIAGKSFSVTNE